MPIISPPAIPSKPVISENDLQRSMIARLEDLDRRLEHLEVMEPLDSYTVSGVGCQAMGIPLEGFGLCNGQFECGPTTTFPLCENWTAENTNVTRVTGGIAGNWCIRGGQAGVGDGGYILSSKYQPVYESLDYQVDATLWGDDAKSEVALGAYCYDQDKTYLGTVWSITGWLPGITPTPRMTRIGPNGDVAWIQGTRYARIVVDLQTDATLTGNYAYVDDVQFGQMKTTYSPQIRLTDGYVGASGIASFTLQADTLYAATAITLTLEEPGYLWFNWMFTTDCDNVTVNASRIMLFIDGAAQPHLLRPGSPIALNRMPITFAGRSAVARAIGNHTLDIRIWVITAGHTVRCFDMTGAAWYTRAY